MNAMNSTLASSSVFEPGGVSPNEASPVSIDQIRDRIENVLDALSFETWLPMGLRAVLAEEVTALRASAYTANPNLKELAQKVNSIALFTFSYGDAVWGSNAVRQIRILDLELDGSHSNGGKNSLDESDWFEKGVHFDKAS